MKPWSPLDGFVLPDNKEVVKEPQKMSDIAADYYEKLFAEPVVYRPHPYTDRPDEADWDNEDETIPLCFGVW